MDKRWTSSKHSVYNCAFHLIWTVKYRRNVLVDGVDIRLKQLLLDKAKEHDWYIENLEVMPDHVHVFIKVTPTDAPSFIVSQLKGSASFILRKEFPSLKSRLPTLWTRAFYCESVGHISEKTIKKYIDSQKEV
jgi:putative transposase